MCWVPLASFNLNHLAALDVLLAERNVGQAARMMGVTQSAMSHTLRALREALNDPLLVRVGNEMVLTAYAEAIRGQLRSGLGALESVLSGRAAFDPSTIEDEFTLALHDGLAAAIAAPLHRRLRAAAPRASLHLATVDPGTLADDLRTGSVDLALIPPLLDVSGLETEERPWMLTDVVVILRRDHPEVGARMSLDQFCSIDHASVSLGGSRAAGYLDDLLARQGRQRSLALRVAYVSALGEVLESSDLIATVPRPAAVGFFCKRWRLRYVEAPLELPRMRMLFAWHGRFDAEPAQRFFRGVVRAAGEELAEVAGVV